jgi:16S rRNA (cytidine1402-2'-O)-methyltransferase
VVALLKDVRQVLGEREIFVARELTKQFEEARRATVTQWLSQFEQTPPRGEFTLILLPAEDEATRWGEDVLLQTIKNLMAQGLTPNEAIREAAKRSGRPKREVYALWVKRLRTHPSQADSAAADT